MDKTKETAAIDAAKDQDLRQFVGHGQPRQAPQPEMPAQDSS